MSTKQQHQQPGGGRERTTAAAKLTTSGRPKVSSSSTSTSSTAKVKSTTRASRLFGGCIALFLFSLIGSPYSVFRVGFSSSFPPTGPWSLVSSTATGDYQDDIWRMLLMTTASSSDEPSANKQDDDDNDNKQEGEPLFEWDDNSEYTMHCHVVEDVCRTSHRWFYRPTTPSESSGTTKKKKKKKQQPHLVWKVAPPIQAPPGAGKVYHRYYRFEHLSPGNASSSSLINMDACTTSEVNNHLVMYSRYNDMLGEFYDRTLVHLDRLSDMFSWVRRAQLYLHLESPYKPLLDSHHLFSTPYRTRPLHSVVDLLDDANCQCLPRLILCGYDAENTTTPPHAPSAMVVASTTTTTSMNSSSEPTIDEDTTTNATITTLVLRTGVGWRSTQSALAWQNKTRYRTVRENLRSHLIDNNPHVRADIATFRDQVFEKLKIPSEDRSLYKLVGLAQRQGRRRWLDLPEIMKSVQRRLRSQGRNVALVEMNLEVDSSSYQQLVRHAALDGLIGIHGAQLTEAIWMNDSSWLVELLPYSPDYVNMGKWTRFVASPTPLGYVIQGTQINHAGYRLPIESAPYCDGDISKEKCWKKNRWDNRDFVTGEPLLRDILDAFFPAVEDSPVTNRTSTDPPLCSDYLDRAGDQFVLYNVHCADGPDSPVDAHSFFWEEN